MKCKRLHKSVVDERERRNERRMGERAGDTTRL